MDGYPILIYYWDVTGNFLKYELIPGKPLTKRKHEPFLEADYQKLTQILKNKHPAFIKLRKDELIIKIENDSVDGVSGATIAAIKDEIVPGAAYSCYTLWHIANGPVVQSIKNHTKIGLNPILVRKLASSNSVDIHYFLVNSFDESDFESYLHEVLNLIKINEGYFLRNVIDKLPGDLGVPSVPGRNLTVPQISNRIIKL